MASHFVERCKDNETVIYCGTFASGVRWIGDKMKYVLWISLTLTFLAVYTVDDPRWWMVLALGIGANGLVCAASDWKMPVRGLHAERVRHTPMTRYTRYKVLADIIPTGFGKASVGDVLLFAGILGTWAQRTSLTYAASAIIGGYMIWVFGWSKGFALKDKWPAEERTDSFKNVPIVLALMMVGNLLNFRGCSVTELRASTASIASAVMPDAPHIKPKSTKQWRDMGKLSAPPPEMLTRLREKTAKQNKELLKLINKELEKQERAVTQVPVIDAKGQVVGFVMASPETPKSARRGPFCRVTCAAHHGGQYDVETMTDLCRANYIPPTTDYVPGWIAITQDTERANPWPGPTQGLESYKLYWSGLQSDAKVLHQSQMDNTLKLATSPSTAAN